MGWRFASAEDREAVVGMIVDAAEHDSLALTPPELALSPSDFRRADGTSVFRPRHSVVFTSDDAAGRRGPAAGSRGRPDRAGGRPRRGRAGRRTARRTPAQQRAGRRRSARIAASGRQVDLLVGPAGAGKTTAMRALTTAWITAHGKGSVVGLAPSAAAAQVLADDLGIACENTAKWLHEHDRGRAQFREGQLVIIDEATLAGTLTLDRITALAADAGAKVLLVGDWAQLQSVDAGGAFSLLASARADTPELTEVHRFTHEWEKHASLDLRDGRVEVIGTYARHDRVREGTTDEMIDAAYAAWRADDARRARERSWSPRRPRSVHDLNRARPRRTHPRRRHRSPTARSTSPTAPRPPRATWSSPAATTADSAPCAAAGSATATAGASPTSARDGSIVVQRLEPALGGSGDLPAEYVAEHVDLGYAVTAHRAQGMTVDTAHVVVSGTHDAGEPLRLDDPRPRLQHRLRRPRQARRQPRPARARRGHRPHRALRRPPALRRRTLGPPDDRGRAGALVLHRPDSPPSTRPSPPSPSATAGSRLSGACGLTDRAGRAGPRVRLVRPAHRRAAPSRGQPPRRRPAAAGPRRRRSLDDAEDIGAVLISRLHKAAQPKRGKATPSRS